jgi:hypothetical protein
MRSTFVSSTTTLTNISALVSLVLMTVLTKDEEYKLDHIFILQLRQYFMSCHCLVSSAAQLQEITY